ncbi:MAG: histidinol dehydrogenase [Muribaculum sp.]|nr:histidinol dehydrogenase [Muribaculaceae bacterium]MCM1081741.1 histidinol dehydrogenase [Muribaculum sp.]
MQIIKNPPRQQWESLTARALAEQSASVVEAVAAIIEQVRLRGDEALREYELKFTGARLADLRVEEDELSTASTRISPQLKQAIDAAAANIERFHSAQMPGEELVVETAQGVVCRQRAVAVQRVGLYVPGGNSPLFSTVLMLAIPAKIAGCRVVELCTPPSADGSVHPAILYAAWRSGVRTVYRTGGAQAIAAMALGTATIGRVDKIFGPGNRFVTEAKQQVVRFGTAIDMPAGPSEVMVIADGAADARFVAADFLSQAEHGPDSQSILVTQDSAFLEKLPGVIDSLLQEMPRRELMKKSLSHSRLILLDDEQQIMDFCNLYAPEHLIINHSDASRLADMVVNAGSVFLGPWSPESAGDYASGTNHTLPTSGYARAYSGVNIDAFIKKITFQQLSPEGIRSIGRTVECMAENEDLNAHKLAMTLRLNELNKDL